MKLGRELPTTLPTYTILVKNELIFFTSHMFQAEIQVVCSSLEEAITRMVQERQIEQMIAH